MDRLVQKTEAARGKMAESTSDMPAASAAMPIKPVGDPWVEGETIGGLLIPFDVLVTDPKMNSASPLVLDRQAERLTAVGEFDWTPTDLTCLFADLLLQLPRVLTKISSPDMAKGIFPEYNKYLIKLAAHLSEEQALEVLEYYEKEGFCLPSTADWVRNLDRVLQAFYVPSKSSNRFDSLPERPSTAVRRKANEILYSHVYRSVRDFGSYRQEVVDQVILPTLECTLPYEEDPEIEDTAWQILTSAAVQEIIEKDEHRRAARTATQNPSAGAHLEPDVHGTFERIRHLALRLATTESPCVQPEDAAASVDMARSSVSSPVPSTCDPTVTSPAEFQTHERHVSSKLKSLAEAISPTSKSKELPISSIAGQMGHIVSTVQPDDSPGVTRSATGTPLPPTEGHPNNALKSCHTRCRSIRAIRWFIATFTRLAFAPPQSLLASGVRLSRLPASGRCLTLFSDLLTLLAPSGGLASGGRDHSSTEAETSEHTFHASCPQARLLVLQWLMRLRANKQHRIWVKPALDEAAEHSASVIMRTKKDIEDFQETSSQSDVRIRRKGPVNPTERGRAERSEIIPGRSRSRSRQPAPSSTANRRSHQNEASPYRPTWCIPDILTFECPSDTRASEGMTTYDPIKCNPALAHSLAEGVYLPISRYINVLLDIIKFEPDWELVSYVLVFLPLQLTNKHFFCGPRSGLGVKELRKLFCDSLLQGQLVSQSRVPQVIKRPDVNTVGYQTLTILISYRKLFSKVEGNAIVEAFQKGLVGQSHAVARVCVQALTICTYELAESLVSYLPSVLQQLSGSSSELGVHLLELLLAIGQVPNLYSNMTEVQYYGIFKLCIDLIQANALSRAATDESEIDVTKSTQTQLVVLTAYLTIFTWFLALSLPRRPNVASYIIKNIVPIFNDGILDESAEVCFDWLCRYTYANADPRPSSSFLSDIVMRSGNAESVVEDQDSKNWILGNAIITITAQPRSGWVVIKTRRPSGTTSLLCKLENVPLLGLGEDDADIRTVQAVLMANRDPEHVERPIDVVTGVVDEEAQTESGTTRITFSIEETPAAGTVAAQPVSAPFSSPSDAHPDPQFSWIWSGSAPSQRRKDVAIDPGYIGLLLSAYPYASLEAPRGRLIKADDLKRGNTSGTEALARTMRNIDSQQVVDTHRIAVLYVAPGQTTERDILGNVDGSQSFLRFMGGLGRLIKLNGQRDIFTGGLDTENDEDGEYAYAWWDDLNQVIYHAPHLMPNKEGEEDHYYSKKRLVGNDFVTIVFNDSGSDYRFDTIDTAFQFINIVISSHTSGVSGDYNDSDEHDFFKVTIQRRPGIPAFSPIGDFKLVSAKSLPLIVRQISLLASHVAQIYQATDMAGGEYITNWRQRYKTIKKLKDSLPPLELREDVDTPEQQAKMWLLRE